MSSQDQEVTWMSLPHKDQLFVLVFARFSEPLARTSIVSYIYYQLRSFDVSLPPERIVEQAATLQTVFTIFQCVTVLLWGRLSDSPRGGRKLVLTIGLAGSMVSCVGFGFVQSFRQALIVRAIEGAVNGNVAVIRTMVSEVVDDQRYKPRAFLLMPMAFNVAVILGPILAYLVAAATNGYAGSDNPHDTTPISNERYPFAPPALLNGAILLIALLLVIFRLKEAFHTLKSLQHMDDPGLRMARKLRRLCLGPKKKRYEEVDYEGLREDESEEMLPLRRGSSQEESTEVDRDPSSARRPALAMLPLRLIFTWNLCLTIASQAILEGHISAYNTLWPSFLSASVTDDGKARSLWSFSGGLGMPIRDVARSLVILGVVGLPLQVFGYPRAVRRFGTLGLWKVFLLGFPLAYFLTPLLAVLPSNSLPPAPRDGAAVWSMIVLVQALVVISGTFVIPAQLTLTNKYASLTLRFIVISSTGFAVSLIIFSASPHPSALGRTHSLAVFLSSLARSVSPIAGGLLFGYGSAHGKAGAVWWVMGIVACCGSVVSLFVVEGNGHEIHLPGDEM